MTGGRVAAIIKVASVPASVRWYRQAGFDVHDVGPADEPTWAEVARDGLVLQLLAGETPWEGAPRFTGSLYVHVDSVEAVYESVRHAVDVPWGVEVRPWGARELTLADPDGYYLTFTEPAG